MIVKATKVVKRIVTCLMVLFVVALIGITSLVFLIREENTEPDQDEVSAEVLAYQPQIETELQKHELEELTPILLGILQQESGGVLSKDIFQASESLGLPPNTITDPSYSIQVGVEYFVNNYESGKAQGVDIESIIQSYNFGRGYIEFAASQGGIHSEELAKEFSAIQMEKYPGQYTCGGDTSNFRYPYCYGDWSYTTKVLSHISTMGSLASDTLKENEKSGL
jgi:hypothetical protein